WPSPFSCYRLWRSRRNARSARSSGSDADVFDSPPRFVTGVGWRGNIVSRLSSGTAVYICRETNVDFGLSSKPWVQIAYRLGPQWPKYGWIIKDALHAALDMERGERLGFFIS